MINSFANKIHKIQKKIECEMNIVEVKWNLNKVANEVI
jgi:hypothetical protein